MYKDRFVKHCPFCNICQNASIHHCDSVGKCINWVNGIPFLVSVFFLCNIAMLIQAYPIKVFLDYIAYDYLIQPYFGSIHMIEVLLNRVH